MDVVPPVIRDAVGRLRGRTPDHVIQARQFQETFGRPIDWRRPRTFNEKIHWIRRYERSPLLPRLADKVRARAYVEERLGPGVLAELIGIWEAPEDIDWTALPVPCVLKVNWGSSMNVFIPDRASLRPDEVSARLRTWLSRSHYWNLREWAYKHIRPRILGERMLQTADGQVPPDIKLFCFDGVPRLVQMDHTRFQRHTRALYRLPWEPIPVAYAYPRTAMADALPAPPNLETLIRYARTLAADLPFVRVDWYDLGDRVVFGEMTWYPEAGRGRFDPPEYDLEFGEWLPLRRIGRA
jgi:hypothetical protein